MPVTSNRIELWKTFPSRLVLIFLLFTAGILILSYIYYVTQRKEIFTENQNYLTAISELKTSQIEQWHGERLGDATVIKDNTPLVRSIRKYSNDRGNQVLREELEKWMASVCSEFDYSGVAIVDTLFEPLIDFQLGDSIKTGSILKQLAKVKQADSIVFTDFHRTGDSSEIHIDILIPLVEPGTAGNLPFSIVILRIDPKEKLYPLIQSWPTPSRTSETLLLRKEGDSILFLNELRHRKGSALKLKVPLSAESVLGVKAVEGYSGVSEGLDYRNIQVIGYLNKIPGLEWYMVTKVDQHELLVPLRRQTIYSVFLTLFLIVTNALIFGYFLWMQRVRSYKNQLNNERTIREAEERFNIAFRMSPVAVTISSIVDNRFLDVNKTFLKDIEYTREEVIGKTAIELGIWADEEDRLWLNNEIRDKKEVYGKVLRYKSQSGRLIYGLSSMSVVNVNGEQCILSTVINVTASVKSDERIKQQYYTLNGIIESSRGPIFSIDTNYCYTTFNQVHARFMNSLYGVDIRLGKNMLDYLTVEEDRNKVKVNLDRALAGEYIEENAWEGDEEDTRRYFEVSHNPILNDSNEVVGVAVNARDQTERKKVEETLYRTQTILQTAMDQSQAGIAIADVPDGKLIYVNDAGLLIRGGDRVSATNGIGIDQYVANWNLFDLDGRPLKADEVPLARAVMFGEKCSREFIIRRGAGDDRIVIANAAPIKDNNGRVISGIVVFLDITETKQIEKELKESEDKFKYVFDNSLMGKSITLPTGEISVNDAFCEMLGYSPEELSKAKWQDISFPDDIEMTEEIVGSILAGRTKSAQFIKRYVHKNGSVVWANVGTALRRDENDNPLYFITSVNDITEILEAERRIRESENRFTLAMKASNDGLYDWNLETNDIYYSPGWKKMLGYEDHELPNDLTMWEKSTEKEDVKKSWEMQQKLISGQIDRFVLEFKMKHKKGHWVDILSRAEAVFNENGKAIRIVGTHTDVTQRKLAEEEIRTLNAELEQRVLDRTAQLEAANKELETFSYSVSHDLRAPLRAVHGYTQILLDEYEQVLDDEGKRLCGIISSGATQMGALIDDLLSFSRVGRSSLHPSSLDMRSLVVSIIAEISGENGSVNFKVGKLHKVYADANLIRLVWDNLISNAIKYSSKKELSEISIDSNVEADMIVYSIKDNGVGFDMQYVNKLFGIFQRLHSESEFEGNGVGLANVKRIISRHNGRIWAEGEVDKGATFWFSLPAAPRIYPPKS